MTACAEAYTLVREIAGLPEPSVKQAINRVVARLLPYLRTHAGRIEDIYYGEARAIRAEEIDALRAVAAQQREKAKAGREQIRQIAGLYLQAAERLRALDPDYHRPEIDRLEREAHALGVVDRAGAAPVGNGPSPNGEGRDG